MQKITGIKTQGFTLNLATALGLRPLDRVQVNSKEALREMRNDQHFRCTNPDLPYWFFQRVLPDGQLCLRAPGGSSCYVEPTEICDIIRGEPIEVMAMTQAKFIEWNSARSRLGGTPPDESFYSPGYLTHVRKDRWGRLDQAWVQFHDSALNTSATFATPLHAADRERVAALMNRKRMPVLGNDHGSYSADHGVQRQADADYYAARQFIAASLRGQKSKALALACIGARPLTTGQINRLSVV